MGSGSVRAAADTSGSVRVVTTPAAREREERQRHLGAQQGQGAGDRAGPSRRAPIAVFATATYWVRRSPPAMSTMYVLRATRIPTWARTSSK
jgi:hypothetical protein